MGCCISSSVPSVPSVPVIPSYVVSLKTGLVNLSDNRFVAQYLYYLYNYSISVKIDKINYNFDCIADLLNYIYIIADNNLDNITCKYENNIDYFKIIINNKKK